MIKKSFRAYITSNEKICNYYRTKDIVHGPYEELPGTFDFWDPHLYRDDDGRFYFYWGCAWDTPIWGVELDAETMRPIGEKKPLLSGDAFTKGYERIGEDHSEFPLSDAQIQEAYRLYLHEKLKIRRRISRSWHPKESWASVLISRGRG